ncbi:hypothetical protein H6S82_00120 [Planktothrix sp. FACHB-1355]|uniref:Uncharacterized protein n=1 Tax=Aerosakkonema funiforme FACHB-1375 TaxID=2949571 RepID=A0A926VDK1_9CYAN|nr:MULTISPECIES: hypothetical protein [Oscillatoriales]MBD2181858.1 hypothetical protein [Aerosakkonema funiforme FACHB-1375]MBD3557278.1 hypothetical protein [Planktothrix sp. FACHB-1355]
MSIQYPPQDDSQIFSRLLNYFVRYIFWRDAIDNTLNSASIYFYKKQDITQSSKKLSKYNVVWSAGQSLSD